MAIEIISKSRFSIPPLVMVGGIICLVVFVVLLSAFLFFNISIKNMSQEVQDKADILLPLKEDIQEKEQLIIPLKEKIDSFNLLVSNHGSTRGIFNLLEEDTLPRVWFSNFNFSLEERQLILSGNTDSFTTLEQQRYVFGQNPLVSSLRLSGVFLSEETGIDFTMEIIFKPSILIPEI